jgi:hypothetical protein
MNEGELLFLIDSIIKPKDMKPCKDKMNDEVRAYIKGTLKQLAYLRNRWSPSQLLDLSKKKQNLL